MVLKKKENELGLLPENYQFNLSDLALLEVKAEQVILNKCGKRAIRLDAWALDVKNRQFNTEMQNDTKQDDIFGKDLAKYTFTEQCEEIPGMPLEDGTTKIFLNMKSKNGRPELISLLQYMKHTTMENPDILVKDKRIVCLSEIVEEVKQSEEWEAVRMNILEFGIQKGSNDKLKEQIRKKLDKGKTIPEIAEDLEETPEIIETLIKEMQ